MDQVSRPLLLALVAVVGLTGAWMLVLRPHPQSGADSSAAKPAAAVARAAAPGTAGLGRAVDRAKGAVAASEASAAKTRSAVAAAAGDAAPASARSAPAKAPVRAAQARPRPASSPVTVLLFAGRGADDALAREVVRSVKRPGVRTIVASIDHVADYGGLVGSVEITGAPTILVIGPDRKAERIVGLPDAAQVEQALAAAR